MLLTRLFHVGVLWRKRNEANVSLTFDDGPDPKFTPRVLDALKAADVKATFFVIVSKAKRHPELVRRMLQEGHEVQIHGYAHACVPLCGPGRSVLQVRQSSTVLNDDYGVRPSLYRPTWGLLNLPAWIWARRHGMTIVTWSVMVGDWRNASADLLLARILRRITAGAVIVLHDSDETFGAEAGAPENVIQLLPRLAQEVRRRGYEFDLLSRWVHEESGAQSHSANA